MSRNRLFHSLIVLVPLLGAARGCGGDEPAILGEVDAGADLGGELEDAGVDLGDVDLDMGVPPEDLGPADMGTAHRFVVRAVGETDSDHNVIIKIGLDGDPRIIHYGEAGFVYFNRATSGVWASANTIVDRQTHLGVGCDMYVSAAIDSSNVTHIAYRYIPGPDGACDDFVGENDTEIRYATVTDTTVSMPIAIETVHSVLSVSDDRWNEVSPAIAVDSHNVAHILYRESTAEPANLRYVSVTDGVASAPITVPNSASGRAGLEYSAATEAAAYGALVPGFGPDGTLNVLLQAYGTVNNRLLRMTAAGWQEPVDLPTNGTITTATVDSVGNVHFIANSYSHFVAHPDGSCVMGPATPPGIGRPQQIAMNSLDEPALISEGLGYVAWHDGAWSEPVILDAPGVSAAEGLSPSLAFDASDRPNIAFQAHFGSPNLFYATPE